MCFGLTQEVKTAYEYFGDVIKFDTTYLTNRYGMPFAPFVGVNHHGQSILLGAGLISSEDTSTFVWLFEAWLECMNGQAPEAIITDQDQTMKNAIQIGLYTERSFWVSVNLKGVFWAGMSTTQRSESMNAFFDEYVHSGTTLKEFVDQFDNALRKKVETEMTTDFQSCNQTIPCVSLFKIEKQVQLLYTNVKFKEVQAEVWGMLLCNPSLVSIEGSISTFDVFEEISTPNGQSKIVKYIVYFNEDECEVKCT
ncbi:protein FAR1-RELATED SEQUENCE 4-like [Juglans microcarpa x Juglans regia]|uniref:protein FAR1-RELATED SEQUENCE 4-like n=1 Tax=Juglans microcarpa x Juglans regia TaxID=2249226 RepID=UPI001B7F1353|nr:protein FAR1-RELATED SEQUENCE 4-like [Juglans microcarpa x Juglans regia]